MDSLLNSFREATVHCPLDAYRKLLGYIQLCEDALFSNSQNIPNVAILLRNINTTYGNDIIFDLTSYINSQQLENIEDYYEYIRFLNFLMHNYWELVRNEPTNLIEQIQISLRFYRELSEGLDYNYIVFLRTHDNTRGPLRPYFFRGPTK